MYSISVGRLCKIDNAWTCRSKGLIDGKEGVRFRGMGMERKGAHLVMT
jgi:hypothetical protein